MLIEVIEQYWKERMDMPIWEWLGISQVTWCVQKKSKISKKHVKKIKEYFQVNVDITEKDFIIYIINNYVYR